MRKILAFCTIILMLFTFSGCQSADKNYVNPPFFTVKDESTGGEVYMLGSMHVGLPNTVYPDEIYDALNRCIALACEVDVIRLDEERAEIQEAMKFFECESAAELMGDDYAEIKRVFVEKGLYNANYEKYIPAMWSIVLTQKAAQDSGYSSNYSTEREFLTYAKKKNIDIIELETAAEQYQINAGQSLELQLYSLKSSVNLPYETLKAQNTALYNAWRENNVLLFETMLSPSGVPEKLAEDFASYYSAMYEKRQEKMADFVIKSLQNGEKIFLMVGAAHFYAKPDILDFLAEAGYSPENIELGNAA